jgi:iron complex transport system ATP-binding protein
VIEVSVSLRSVHLGPRRVLEDVCFQCNPGQHTAILGPNGAGKTTLLKAIAGLLKYDGEVLVGGRALSSLSARERARTVSYVPQESLLNAELSVAQVAMQGRYCHQSAWGWARAEDVRAVEQALALTDALHLRERSYLELSGGEQRRVLLARALATDAPIILLDEPASALDIAHVLMLFEQLNCLAADGKCLVTVMHQLPDAERFCDRIVLLDSGRVRYAERGPLPEYLLQEVYGVNSEPGREPRYTLARGAPAANPGKPG